MRFLVVKDVPLILALAALWTLSGFLIGLAIEALFGTPWVIPCTALNLIAGMVMLLLVTRDDRARRMFYEGPREDELGSPLVGLLWAFPLTLMIIAVIWWLLAQLLK